MKDRLDIQQARTSMSPSLGYWRDLGAVPKMVRPTEVVLRMAGGQHEAHSGVLVLTDQRLLFVTGRHLRWSVARSEMLASCDYGEMFATLTIEAAGLVFEVRFVDSKDATALVTSARGVCRRLPRALAIVC